MTGYVYWIRNDQTGALYIGHTMTTPMTRWLYHFEGLRFGTHHCWALQQAWAAGTLTDFSFKVLSVHDSLLATRKAERRAYDKARAAGRSLYNTVRPGPTPLRVIPLPSTAAEWMSIEPGFRRGDVQIVHHPTTWE